MGQSKPRAKLVVSMVQYEDGTYEFVVPDHLSTLERLDMSLAARSMNQRLMETLAEQLVEEIEKAGILTP